MPTLSSPPYFSLARKWRPSQLDEVIGQRSVVYTLSQAVRFGRLYPSYLLTGSRGVGKTSIARLLAKLIRCEAPQEGLESLLRSCGACKSCLDLLRSTSVDVLEIDGASYNGVDAVRDMRDQAQYLPTYGSKKIYVIDEVHMLSGSAFNALLKILEEPPPHVLFIFATTEPQKIPETILSRCQRFDCKRISLAQIQAHLEEVTQREKISVEPGALFLIARAAEGGLRDALSLLDQVICYCGQGPVTQTAVRESLGTVDEESIFRILTGIFKKDPQLALGAIEALDEQGHSLKTLVQDSIEWLHLALLLKIHQSLPPSRGLSLERKKELQDLVSIRTLEEIELIFQVFYQSIDWIHRSYQPRIVWDVLIIKCACADFLKYIYSSDSQEQLPQQKEKFPVNKLAPLKGAAILSSQNQVQSEKSETLSPPFSSPGSSASLPGKSLDSESLLREQGGGRTLRAGVDPDWENFILHIKKSHPLLSSFLEHSNGVEILSEELKISFEPEKKYFKDQIQTRHYQEPLRFMIFDYFKKHMKLSILLEEKTSESLVIQKEKEARHKRQTAEYAAKTHPIIQEAQSLFGGTLGPIVLKNEVIS